MADEDDKPKTPPQGSEESTSRSQNPKKSRSSGEGDTAQTVSPPERGTSSRQRLEEGQPTPFRTSDKIRRTPPPTPASTERTRPNTSGGVEGLTSIPERDQDLSGDEESDIFGPANPRRGDTASSRRTTSASSGAIPEPFPSDDTQSQAFPASGGNRPSFDVGSGGRTLADELGNLSSDEGSGDSPSEAPGVHEAGIPPRNLAPGTVVRIGSNIGSTTSEAAMPRALPRAGEGGSRGGNGDGNGDGDGSRTRPERPAMPLVRSNSAVNADMTLAMTDRRDMLRPLFDRIREDRLYTNAGDLTDLQSSLRDQLQPLDMGDVERFYEGFIEDFRHRLDHLGLEPALPVEVRNQMTTEMNELANGMRNLMVDAAGAFLRNDTQDIRSVCVDLNNIISMNPNRRSSWVQRPSQRRSSSRHSISQRPSSRRRPSSRVSTESGPERVQRFMDREQLNSLTRAQLIDLFLARQDAHSDETDHLNDELMRYEESMMKLQGERDAAIAASQNVRADYLADVRQAFTTGTTGERLRTGGGEVPTHPALEKPPSVGSGTARSRRAQADSNPSTTPATQSSDRERNPESRAAGVSNVSGAIADDGMAFLQRIITLLLEEEDLTRSFVAIQTQRVAISSRTPPSSDSPSSNRMSGTSSATSTPEHMTKQQLLVRYREADEDRTALRAEKEEWMQRALHGHDIDNLSPAERDRIIQALDRPLVVLSELMNRLNLGSQMVANFAKATVQAGRMNTGLEDCQDALRGVQAIAHDIAQSIPRRFEPDLDNYGQFEQLVAFQAAWLPTFETFFDLNAKLFNRLDALTTQVAAWNAANPRDANGNPLRGSGSSRGRRSILGRTASNISNMLFGDEEAESQGGTAYVEPEWLRVHPDGPCDDCEPVLRFPGDIFQGGVDPGACTCGSGAPVGQQPALAQALPARNRTSGSSRVSFADERTGPNAPNSQKSPKGGILKNETPARLDTGRANASRGRGYRVLASPYPPGAPFTPTRDGQAYLSFDSPATRRLRTDSSSFVGQPDDLDDLGSVFEDLGIRGPRTGGDDRLERVLRLKPCCEHFNNETGLCDCLRRCHWCCRHWVTAVGCVCGGKCTDHECCDHYDAKEDECECMEDCYEHRDCCTCGYIKHEDGTSSCKCGNTCNPHAVCPHFDYEKPEELSCMRGCEDLINNGVCDHEEIPLEGGGTIRDCQSPCRPYHPCCEHHKIEEGRAYCACAKRCSAHACCIHYEKSTDSTCMCFGECDDHLLQNIPGTYRAPTGAATGALGAISKKNQTPGFKTGSPGAGPGMGARGPASATHAHHGCTCNCRCRVGGRQNVLTTKDGRRVAYFTCRNMVGQLPPVPPGPARSLSLSSTSAGSPAESPQPPAIDPLPSPGGLLGLISRTGSSRAPSISAATPAGSPPGQAPHRTSQPRSRSRGPLELNPVEPPERGSHNSSHRSSNARASQASPVAPPSGQSVQNASQRSSLSRGPQSPSAATPSEHEFHNLSQGPHSSRQSRASSEAAASEQSFHSSGSGRRRLENDPEAGGARPDSRHDEGPPRDGEDGDGQLGGQPDEDQLAEGEPGNGQQLGGGQPGGGGGGGGGRGPRWPRDPEPQPGEDRPEWQVLQLLWVVFRWLTFGQLHNLWAISQFVWALVQYYGRPAMAILGRLLGRRRGAVQSWIPIAPREEILSFALWCLVVGHMTMLVAMGEERRLWLAANPRTASYMRGLRHRQPYPWWSPYEVDYALLSPAMDGWGLWLHKAYFRPGLASMLATVRHPIDALDGAFGNATWIGRSAQVL